MWIRRDVKENRCGLEGMCKSVWSRRDVQENRCGVEEMLKRRDGD